MEQKELSGVLFKNDYKKNETHPDFKGNAKIANKVYIISAWKKLTKVGAEYLSIAFKEKQ